MWPRCENFAAPQKKKKTKTKCWSKISVGRVQVLSSDLGRIQVLTPVGLNGGRSRELYQSGLSTRMVVRLVFQLVT